MKQKERVIKWCENGRYINNKIASDELGICDLQGVIRDLKVDGYTIIDQWQKGVNRWGDKARYKNYWVML